MSSRSRSIRIRAVAGLAALGTAALGVAAVPGSASAAGGGDHRATPRHSLNSSIKKHAPSARAILPKKGSYGFLLRLNPSGTASRFSAVRAAGTKAEAVAAAKRQLDTIQQAQRGLESHLSSLRGTTSVLYRTHAVMAGVAVRTDVRNASALSKLPGVTAVYPITPKKPDNSYAVPFQGAPMAWQGDSSGKNLGQGVTIADIDTGLDYTHADFGGAGTVAAYEAAHAADTAAPAVGSFDPAKFDAVDSYDLAGDDYNADPTDPATYQPTPHPDPNPLDCSPTYGGEGHGSHTAGTLAGYGVTAAGATFTGPYDTAHVSIDQASDFEIGPGMAPKAKLISYRVFGCGGSTDVVSDAIDRAMDPNGDGDTSDHANVINMSLGSDFGSPDDADAVQADLAAKLGVTLSISMGNSYDAYDVGGSPGVAQRAITVAASVDADSVVDETDYTIDGAASQRGASERSIAYDWASKPDLSGQVVLPDPADDPAGCTAYNDPSAVAGKIVLLTWSDADPSGIDGCGSKVRGGLARAAGAIGFVFASDSEAFSAGITGDDTIPGVLVARSVGAAMKNAVAAHQTVMITGTRASAYTQHFPGDNDKMTDFSSRGIRAAGHLKPDVAAVGASVFSVLPGSGTQGQNMSGTSMAAPMVGGLAALVIGKHRTWTPEQVKADIMNTADNNLYVGGAADPASARYAPMRVGSGRIDAASALANSVLAYVADDPGAVSASFGPLAVTKAATMTKTIRLQNTGSAAVTYNTGYDPITRVPGVSYSVSPASVTVGAGSRTSVTLTLSVPDAAHLAQNTAYDPTHAADDQGVAVDPATGLPVDVLAEASGNVTFTPTSGSVPALRVPAYAAPRPASSMTAPSQAVLDNGGTGSLRLSGTDFGWASATPKFSLAAGFELQATSATAPKCSTTVTAGCLRVSEDAGADIADVGTTSDGGYLYVAVASHGEHSTVAGKVEFDVYLDTDNDGQPDLVDYNTRYGNGDVFVSELVDLNAAGGPTVIDDEFLAGLGDGYDTAVYDSDVITLPISLTALGSYLTGSSLTYGVVSFTSSGGDPIDSVGLANGSPQIPVNISQPAVVLSDDNGLGSPYVADESGNAATVSVDSTSFKADGGQGLLLLHPQNAPGSQAQVVSFRASTDPVVPNVTLSTSAASVPAGTPVSATAMVTDPAGLTPTGKVTLVDTVSGTTVSSAPVAVGADGAARFSYTPTAQGAASLEAVYTPTAGSVWRPSESPEVPLTVTAATSSGGVSKSASIVTLKVKKKVHLHHRLKVTVSVATVGGVTPTGAVTVKVGKASRAVTLAGGRAALKVKITQRHKVKVVATYLGDAHYLPGGSAPVRVRVV